MIILRNVTVKAFNTDGSVCVLVSTFQLMHKHTKGNNDTISYSIYTTGFSWAAVLPSYSDSHLLTIVKPVDTHSSVCVFYSSLHLEHCVVRATESVMSKSIALANLLR